MNYRNDDREENVSQRGIDQRGRSVIRYKQKKKAAFRTVPTGFCDFFTNPIVTDKTCSSHDD
jgi:hypothetical protein